MLWAKNVTSSMENKTINTPAIGRAYEQAKQEMLNSHGRPMTATLQRVAARMTRAEFPAAGPQSMIHVGNARQTPLSVLMLPK